MSKKKQHKVKMLYRERVFSIFIKLTEENKSCITKIINISTIYIYM